MDEKIAQLNDIIENQKFNINLIKNIFLENNRKIFIIGKNKESVNLLKYIKIDGIIDDYANTLNNWNNIPIVLSNQIGKNDIVINCSTSISPLTVRNNLNSRGVNNILDYYELAYFDKRFLFPDFVYEMRDSFQQNIQSWIDIYNNLVDEISKNTFIDILKYRLTCNPSYMKNYTNRIKDQYMEDFMKYNNEVFVDIGGFDGDTTFEFCNRYQDYKKVLFFEPSNINMNAAKNRLKNFTDIEFYPFGLSDKEEVLYFNESNGSASSIDAEGLMKIKVTKLDKIIEEQISFIKMDIEGWEMNALKGAELTLKKYNPKLAIAVYHNSADMIDIFKFINNICRNYQVYIRHYTEGWSETIMFFLPLK